MMTTYRSLAKVARSIATVALLAIGTSPACATEPRPRPTALDPSNPEAPESPRAEAPLFAAAVSPAPAPVAAPPTPAPSPAAKDEKPAAQTYTCPMHPEVVSDQPGRCPKCGMKLVPREAAAPGGKK